MPFTLIDLCCIHTLMILNIDLIQLRNISRCPPSRSLVDHWGPSLVCWWGTVTRYPPPSCTLLLPHQDQGRHQGDQDCWRRLTSSFFHWWWPEIAEQGWSWHRPWRREQQCQQGEPRTPRGPQCWEGQHGALLDNNIQSDPWSSNLFAQAHVWIVEMEEGHLLKVFKLRW